MPVQYNPTDSRFLTVAQSRTNNGQKDIRIILDIPTNDFYSLDDDGNFNIIGGAGTITLEQVLTQGNSTGGVAIISPDGLTELTAVDTQAGLYCTDAIALVNSIYVQTAKIEHVAQDTTSDEDTLISQDSKNILLQNTSGSGNQINQVTISQTKVGIENNLSGSQIQQIYVDGDSCNMKYEDSINIIDVELGLTNGFRAVQTVQSGDYENFVQVQFDKVQLVYNDIAGGINHELKVDADGYFLKNLPAYADDTAASGLTVGYLYQTDGTGASPLDVAGILMIKQ
jgi:hypothetical protein